MTKRLLVLLALACTVEGAWAAPAQLDAPIGEARRTVRRVAEDDPATLADPKGTPSHAPPSPPRPALANFGLGLAVTGAGVSGLTAFLSLMAKNAAARACANRCPPSTWSAPDPSAGTLGRISALSLALGAAGAGLTLGSIALQHRSKATGSSKPRSNSPSLAVKPMPGGVGLSVKF